MTIKGLTDRGLSFPEIGQIRKGAVKTDPKKPGADLNYFRVVFDEKEIKAAKEFHDIYKDTPQAIRIILPFNEIDRMWDAWLEAYTSGRMVARSDGENFIYLIDSETNDLLVKNGIDLKTNSPRPYQDGAPVGFYTNSSGKKEPIFCKPNGRLRVIIPELARAAYLTVMTTSVHDIANISDQLRAFQTLNNGRIAGIPLILRRRPKKISTPSANGQRARRVKWLLSIEADPEWVKAALQETKRLALPGNGLALSPDDEDLPDPIDGTDYDDGEIQDGEFITVEQEQTQSSQLEQEKKANGNGQRPYPPAVLKEKLEDKAKGYSDKKSTEKQRSLVAMLLSEAFAPAKEADLMRHALQMHLFGVETLKDVSDPLILAILNDWLKPTQDTGGAYLIDPMAFKEIHLAYDAAIFAQGQKPLPGMEETTL